MKNLIKNNCKICTKQYFHKPSKKNSKYCSRLCANRGAAKGRKKIFLKKSCSNCNKEFEYHFWKRPNAKYCSRKCKGIDNRLKTISDDENILIIKKKYEKNVIREEKDCYGWKGSIQSLGYGMLIDGRKNQILSHRASWIINKGQIPDGEFILHYCDTPICSKIDHLFKGGYKENMQDMIKKGRGKGQFKKGIKAYNRKITEEQIRSIRNEEFQISCIKLAKKYQVDKSVILDIKHNNTYKEIE